MSRRLEIELTSQRPDGSWTWRAAGAKQPKGELDGSILPEGAAVGEVLRAEADFLIDGIEILSVLPPKGARKEPERLEILGSGRDEPLVTTQLAPRRGRRDGDRRRPRREGEDRGPRRERGDRGPGGEREERRPRGPRPAPVPERPRPKRLRPGRTHRSAVLADVPAEQRPIAEQVLRGGVPAVRDAVAKQNAEAAEQHRPELPAEQVVAMAEQLLPRLRAAEWLDRAEAAKRDLDVLDLRDLRSVVVASEGVARDEESRALLAELQTGLNRRVEEEHQLWLADITANLDAGRFVRALRLSSRPPKAGTPVPPELAARLVADVSRGLDERTNQELWAAALDALAFSPVRQQVTPAGRPAEPTEELLEAVRRVADRLPAIAELFGVSASEAAAARRRSRPGRARGGRGAGRAGGDRPPERRGAAGAGGEARQATGDRERRGATPPAPTESAPESAPTASAPTGPPPTGSAGSEDTAGEQRPEPVPSEDPRVPAGSGPEASEDPHVGDALTEEATPAAGAEPAVDAAPDGPAAPAGAEPSVDAAPSTESQPNADPVAATDAPTSGPGSSTSEHRGATHDPASAPSEDPAAPAADGPLPSEDPHGGDPLVAAAERAEHADPAPEGGD